MPQKIRPRIKLPIIAAILIIAFFSLESAYITRPPLWDGKYYNGPLSTASDTAPNGI